MSTKIYPNVELSVIDCSCPHWAKVWEVGGGRKCPACDVKECFDQSYQKQRMWWVRYHKEHPCVNCETFKDIPETCKSACDVKLDRRNS